MVEINFEAPKVQEYCDLRLNAGMSPKSVKLLKRGTQCLFQCHYL